MGCCWVKEPNRSFVTLVEPAPEDYDFDEDIPGAFVLISSLEGIWMPLSRKSSFMKGLDKKKGITLHSAEWHLECRPDTINRDLLLLEKGRRQAVSERPMTGWKEVDTLECWMPQRKKSE